MGRILFSSDLHLGHANILKFSRNSREGRDIVEHDHWVIEQLASNTTKEDTLWLLGDICMDKDPRRLSLMNAIPAKKHLIMGNHDQFPIQEYLKYFQTVRAVVSFKGFWISHMPMHQQELYGKRNIHGHVHNNSIRSHQYINVCTETNNGVPVDFEDIRSQKFTTHDRPL